MGQKDLHYPALISQINALAEQDTIILAWLDNAYFPVFRLWYSFFKQHNLKNLLVFALDGRVERKLKALGIPTCRIDRAYTSKREIWGGRPELVREIISAGINIIQTDIDAFWLRNILPDVYSSSADLAISVEYGIPKELIPEWGFTLCCGFYFLRSNEHTKAFLQRSEFVSRSRKVGSDQSGLNWALFHSGVKWSSTDTTHNHGYIDQYAMHVEAISTSLISRHAHEDGDPEIGIFHPFLGRQSVYSKLGTALAYLQQIGQDQKRLSALGRMKYREHEYWIWQARRLFYNIRKALKLAH